MKKILAISLCLLLVLMAGCTPKKTPSPATPTEFSFSVWYPDQNALLLHEEKRTLTLEEGAEWEREVLNVLYAGPESEELVQIISGSVDDILTINTKDGICTVDLSKAFVSANTGGSTLERFVLGSIVNTLCSQGDIEAVKFNVEGNTAAEYGGHFILDEPWYPVVEKTVTVSLWYPDENALALHEEKRDIIYNVAQGPELKALEALFYGPESEELVSFYKAGTWDILSVKTENGLCTVDLSEEFVRNNSGGSTLDGFVLSGMTRALCSLPGIEQVKFNVEGNEAYDYGGHVSLDQPFSAG